MRTKRGLSLHEYYRAITFYNNNQLETTSNKAQLLQKLFQTTICSILECLQAIWAKKKAKLIFPLVHFKKLLKLVYKDRKYTCIYAYTILMKNLVVTWIDVLQQGLEIHTQNQ